MILPSFVLLTRSESKERRKVPHGQPAAIPSRPATTPTEPPATSGPPAVRKSRGAKTRIPLAGACQAGVAGAGAHGACRKPGTGMARASAAQSQHAATQAETGGADRALQSGPHAASPP